MTPTAILKLAVDVLHVPCFLRVYDDEGMTLVEIADVHGRDTGVSAKMMHSSGEWIRGRCFLPVPEGKNPAQAFGSALKGQAA